MRENASSNRKWLWSLSGLLLLTLTGCGMYPSKPGAWPGGIWGTILKAVSSVIDFFAHLIGVPSIEYGLSLLIVTALVRTIVLPFFVKQIRHTKVMQQMQPEIQKIRAKHKGDNKKIQEETMKLWQQAGVNPMAGCFPMLLQLPILYALYGAIEGNVGLNHSVFLGIFSLGKLPGKPIMVPPGVPHWTLYIIPLLAAITTYLSSRVMMAGNEGQQRMMLFIMPVFIFIIAIRFPPGLALYWFYSNLYTAIQGYFVKVRPATKEPAVATAGTQKPAKKSSKKDNGN